MISRGVAVVVRASMQFPRFQNIVFPPDWTEMLAEYDEEHQQKVPFHRKMSGSAIELEIVDRLPLFFDSEEK